MAKVFEGKVRRLGNSLAVIIPRDVLLETGLNEGDVVRLSLPINRSKRREALNRVAGMDSGAKAFAREKGERV